MTQSLPTQKVKYDGLARGFINIAKWDCGHHILSRSTKCKGDCKT